MPTFQYKGYKNDGAEISGTIEADGLKDAVSKIKQSGLFPKEVREQIHKEKGIFSRKDSSALLPSITRQLSVLSLTGVPLIEALKSMSDEAKGRWKRILTEIREDITEGSSLSRAMSGHKETFPEFYLNMVAAGEASGNLGQVLSKLADFLENQEDMKNKVRTAMIYPIFMICIGVIVLSFLFIFVVPKIVKIFEDTKSALPLITVVLIKISNLLKNYWWLLILLLSGSFIGYKRFREKNALLLDKIILKAPGNIIQTLYFSRFARTLGFLLGGGLPMLRALELSSKSAGNLAIEEKIRSAGQKVAEGARLSSSLEGFPPVLLQLISTGEKSGQLVEVLNKTADSYEEEFSRKVQKALSLLEPVMILVMGAIVAFVVFAVLLPLFQLNQIIK